MNILKERKTKNTTLYLDLNMSLMDSGTQKIFKPILRKLLHLKTLILSWHLDHLAVKLHRV